MSSSTGERLARAFQLIEADDLNAAQNILKPILAAEPDNADAWWVYAHAVTDPDLARDALNNVLRIDSEYPGAAELMRKLNLMASSEQQPAPSITRINPIAPPPPPTTVPEPPDLPEKDELPDIDDEDLELEKSPRRGGPNPVLIIVGLLIVVAVVVGVMALLQSQTPPSPTQVVSDATGTTIGTGADDVSLTATALSLGVATTETTPDDIGLTATALIEGDTQGLATEVATEAVGEVTETAAETSQAVTTQEVSEATEAAAEATEIVATEPVVEAAETDEPAVESTAVAVNPADYAAIIAGLADFTVVEDGVSVQQTALGETLLISICSAAGAQLRSDVPAAMEAIAQQSGQVGENIDGIGARMLNCESNRTLLVIGVEREEAVSFAEGSLTLQEFERLWRPL